MATRARCLPPALATQRVVPGPRHPECQQGRALAILPAAAIPAALATLVLLVQAAHTRTRTPQAERTAPLRRRTLFEESTLAAGSFLSPG